MGAIANPLSCLYLSLSLALALAFFLALISPPPRRRRRFCPHLPVQPSIYSATDPSVDLSISFIYRISLACVARSSARLERD